MQNGGGVEVRSDTESLGRGAEAKVVSCEQRQRHRAEGAEVGARLELCSWHRDDQMTELDAEAKEK